VAHLPTDTFFGAFLDMPDFPSGVRVFAKSLHWLAAGWFVAVVWLWVAMLRQHMLRRGGMPPDYALASLIQGFVSAAALEMLALWCVRATGKAPNRPLERREWHHAFWWSAFPNLMLIGTAYLLILSSR